MTDNIALWYAARATGLVALLLLTASMVWGIAGAMRSGPAGWPRFTVTLLHRNLTLVTVAFLGVHVGSSVIDSYAGIGWLDPVLPFGSTYKPFWLGLGAIAWDLLLAIVVSSLVRRWISLRVWRVLHWASYLCWPVALLHAIGIGTDSRGGWPLGVAVACLAAVGIAAMWRLGSSRRPA